MALSNVTVKLIGGKSGRPLPGFDHYTGLMFYGTAPTVTGKWKTYPGPPAIKAQQLFSLSDAVAAGILPYTENTAASGSYEITTPGASGATLELIVTLPKPNGSTEDVSLGEYTVPSSGAATATLQATGYAALINAGTVTHGFTATSALGVVTIFAPKNQGIALNTGTPLTATVTGAFVGTRTQFSAGTVSSYAIWYYHIERYFTKFPQGVLWVGIIASSSSFNEVTSLRLAGESKIRQIGVYDNHVTRGNASNIIGTALLLHNAVIDSSEIAPFMAVYSPNIAAVTDLSTYPDQNINTAEFVQTVISQDGEATGAQLFVHSGQTIGNIGDKLATLSASRVSASDAQATPDNNISDGVENNVIAFGNGQLKSSLTDGLISQLDSYNYTFLRDFADELTGSYWNDNKMMVTRSSDFANANDVRTIQKVQRLLKTAYIPILNSEIYFKDDGTMQDWQIEALIDSGVDSVTNAMITGFGNNPLISNIDVTIDPTQKLKITSELVVESEIEQNGIARKVTVKLSYSAS